jgi:hypothetical protein
MKRNRFAQNGTFARSGALALVCFITLVACGLGSAAQSTTAHSTLSPSQPTATPSSSRGGTNNSKPILWTHLAANDDRILLYQRSSHTATIARLDSGGSLVVMKTYTGTMDDWTHVVGAGKGFLFYNRDTRAGAVAHVAADGSLVYVKQYAAGSFGDWTDIAGADAGVLFYNRDTCVADFTGLTDDGSLVNQVTQTVAQIGCDTTIAATKRGDYLLYEDDSASAYFATAGGGDIPFVSVHRVTGFAPWSRIVGAEDLFYFYNRANHQPYVGQWDSTSVTFTNTHPYQPGEAPDFTLLAATSDHIVYYNSDPNVHAGGVWQLNEDGTLSNATRF